MDIAELEESLFAASDAKVNFSEFWFLNVLLLRLRKA